MMGFARSAYVIARRDFTATVYSKTFVFFLLGPLIIIGISILFGNVAERSARQDTRPTVAVVAGEAGFAPIQAARDRLNPAFGERALPDLVRAEPDYDAGLQVETLLASKDKRILAVLTGGLERPTLTGAIGEEGQIRTQMGLILDEARQHEALARAAASLAPVAIRVVQVEESAGSLAATRAMTARAGQLLLFTLTVLLAGMLLSNLIEEKSNKVIEVLAAAVPVDAIFVGKLFAMLAVSLVGVCVWAAGALLATALWSSGGGFGLTAPAVGWPLFIVLVLVYYAANYLLLGALFLGIGSQASSIREVQTLSMPVTVGQMLIFLFASLAVGPFNSLIGIAAAVFPFSSPMAMVGRAAQTPEYWPHLAAFVWQAFWVWLTVSLAAALFRRNVMKSGSPATRSRRRRRAKG
jgi:ABC-2 type transport system permease protein